MTPEDTTARADSELAVFKGVVKSGTTTYYAAKGPSCEYAINSVRSLGELVETACQNGTAGWYFSDHSGLKNAPRIQGRRKVLDANEQEQFQEGLGGLLSQRKVKSKMTSQGPRIELTTEHYEIYAMNPIHSTGRTQPRAVAIPKPIQPATYESIDSLHILFADDFEELAAAVVESEAGLSQNPTFDCYEGVVESKRRAGQEQDLEELGKRFVHGMHQMMLSRARDDLVYRAGELSYEPGFPTRVQADVFERTYYTTSDEALERPCERLDADYEMCQVPLPKAPSSGLPSELKNALRGSRR
jgi:hypothetical protein